MRTTRLFLVGPVAIALCWGLVACAEDEAIDGADGADGDTNDGGTGDTTPGDENVGGDTVSGDEDIGDPCVDGNELGVGMLCTQGGAECNNNTGAILCTTDFGADPPGFCVRACTADEDCGTGGVCRGDPDTPDDPRKGCVLEACI